MNAHSSTASYWRWWNLLNWVKECIIINKDDIWIVKRAQRYELESSKCLEMQVVVAIIVISNYITFKMLDKSRMAFLIWAIGISNQETDLITSSQSSDYLISIKSRRYIIKKKQMKWTLDNFWTFSFRIKIKNTFMEIKLILPCFNKHQICSMKRTCIVS